MSLVDQLPIIGSILRHDSKVTTYKIALVRAINDVAMSYPDLEGTGRPVAVPLRILAEYWVAYYWPFVNPVDPLAQGIGSIREGQARHDISFRAPLTALRQQYEDFLGLTGQGTAADGSVLVHDLRLVRQQLTYPPSLLAAYREALAAIVAALRMPIRYARGGEGAAFSKPARARDLPQGVIPVPGTLPGDLCLTIAPLLWSTFRKMALWIDALCIYEWCLFTGRLPASRWRRALPGEVFELLTAQPENRRSLSWERAQIGVLLAAGEAFICPWTGQRITASSQNYDLDHLLPISVYPINELWNLLPADLTFNRHVKGNRLPSTARLAQAKPRIVVAYQHYLSSPTLAKTLREDVAVRFATVPLDNEGFPVRLATAAADFIEQIATARSLARFS